MFYVRIVLLADVLHQLPIQQHGTDRELPGLGVGLRIIDGMFDFQISPVYAPEALNDMQRFGGGKTGGIDPVSAVYGCLGKRLNTDTLVAQLRGRH